MKKLVVGSLCALMVGLFSVAPASGDLGGPEVDPAITDGSAATALAQARSMWKAHRVGNYRLKVARGCFCAPPRSVTVTVRRGKPVRTVKSEAGKWYGPRTVPATFKVIAAAIKQKVASIDVKYNRKFGYPKSISVDQIAMAIDDEYAYTMKFGPLAANR